MQQAENEIVQEAEVPAEQQIENKPIAELGNDWQEVDANKSEPGNNPDPEPDPSDDPEDPVDPEGPQEPGDDEEEFYLGDEKLESPSSDEDKDPALVKTLRNVIKEKERELKELRHAATSAPVQIQEMPPKPTLESSDYDEVAFEQKLTEWHDTKRKIDDAKAKKESSDEAYRQQHNAKVNQYLEDRKAVKFKGFDVAERRVTEEVPISHQNFILDRAKNPTLVVMAIGSNAELRKQLSEATDPAEIGWLIGNIEAKAKTLPKGKKQQSSTPEVKGGSVQRRSSADIALAKVLPDAVFK